VERSDTHDLASAGSSLAVVSWVGPLAVNWWSTVLVNGEPTLRANPDGVSWGKQIVESVLDLTKIVSFLGMLVLPAIEGAGQLSFKF